jgi:hypothetical protein
MSKALVALMFIVGTLFSSTSYTAPLPSAGIITTVGKWVLSGGEKAYYVQVEGRGATEREAQLAGFTVAIENAVGTLVLSERESDLKGMKRNDIIDYSSGVVKKWEQIDRKTVGDEVVLKMDVWVMYNEYLNRKALDDTDAIRKEKARTLFKNMMRDYPRNVFKADVGRTNLTYENGSPVVNIPITLKFSREWINAISDVAKRTRDYEGVDGCAGVYGCQHRRNTFNIRDGWFGPFSETAYSYHDHTIPELFVHKVTTQSLYVKMFFTTSRGQKIACWDITKALKDTLYGEDRVLVAGINPRVDDIWYLKAGSSVNHNLYITNNYGISNEEFLMSMPKNIELAFDSSCRF